MTSSRWTDHQNVVVVVEAAVVEVVEAVDVAEAGDSAVDPAVERFVAAFKNGVAAPCARIPTTR